MKRFFSFLALALLLSSVIPPAACAIEGYRGSTWGDLRWDLPREYDSNILLRGWVKQGIDWKRWGKNTTLNTYATLRYSADSEELDWNNTIEPGIGISIETYNPAGFATTFGCEYVWENRFLDSDYSDQKFVIYVGWYGFWDLKK